MSKSLFEQTVVDEILTRIDNLKPSLRPEWGGMNVGQMIKHCTEAMKMGTGEIKPKRIFIGRIIGSFLKSSYYNEKPFGKNSPTAKEIKITDEHDFNNGIKDLKLIVQKFISAGPSGCTKHPHPFFGSFAPEQWSIGMYKHLDHHLRQFGV